MENKTSAAALHKLTLPEEARIKELYEQISIRCARLQQLGQAVRIYKLSAKVRVISVHHHTGYRI